MNDIRTLAEWDELFREPLPRQLTLTFSDGTVIKNDRIVQESLLLEEALCSDQNLKYGCCEAANFRIRIVVEPLPPERPIIDSDGNKVVTDDGSVFMDGSDYAQTIDKSFEGLYLDAIMTFDTEHTGLFVTSDDEYFVTADGERFKYRDIPTAHLGRYKVISDRPTSDRMYRDLNCYDTMYDILDADVVNWYNLLTFPITIKDMRDSFFTYLGIKQAEVELINDDFVVNGEFKADYTLSGKEIIEAICELNGVFGHIDRYGVFEYISLPTSDSLTYPYYQNGTSSYEDYVTSEITMISLSSDSSDESITVGTEGNTYYMRANPLTFAKDDDEDLQTALENLLGLISQFQYRPYNTTTYGNPMLPVGTNITFNTRYKPIESFVMSRLLEGIQAMKDTFTAYGLREYPKDTNNSSNDIGRAKSTSTQAANAEVVKVDSSGNMVTAKLSQSASKGSLFNLNADNIQFVANSVLNMKAAKLNIESDKVSITQDGKLNAVDASFEGRVDATSMLFWETLQAYSSYQDYTYDFATFYNAPESFYMRLKAPTSGTAQNAITLVGYDAGELDGYMGVLHGDWLVVGSLRVNGTKPRVVATENYGRHLLYAYETASPTFGDIGDGQIAEDGECRILLDPIFAETISTTSYQVFLQKCGEGDCYVAERNAAFFVVKGTPGMEFCWEIKAKQSDFDQRRMEPETLYTDVAPQDYGEIGAEHIHSIMYEREVV